MTDKQTDYSSFQAALQKWADMYNKADKERVELLLENKKLKQELDLLKLQYEQERFNSSEYSLRLGQERKKSEFLLNEFWKVDKRCDKWREKAEKYRQVLNEIEKLIPPPKGSKLNLVFGEILKQITKVENEEKNLLYLLQCKG